MFIQSGNDDALYLSLSLIKRLVIRPFLPDNATDLKFFFCETPQKHVLWFLAHFMFVENRKEGKG